ncbi:MAG: HAD hydrolase-like protein [Pseudomonadota bacterium]|nr:HAD hydrolase-like protein [Pseudomonadota bacterium]
MSEAFLIPAPDALDLTAVIDIYQTQRAMMPSAVLGAGRQRRALIDILDEFDGLILDGYGVINVGANLVAGIEELLQVAADRNKPVVVLTNGGSFESSVAAEKYAKWRLPIMPDAVVSSRDALHAALKRSTAVSPSNAPGVIGCLGAVITPLPGDDILAYGRTEDFWHKAGAFALLGVIDWTDQDQAGFEAALTARPRPIFVANPDVAAPQTGHFSPESGYWMARAMRATQMSAHEVTVHWYGKPYRPAFDLALERLNKLAGRHLDRRRVAMVGDSLHTDILGGGAAGLQSVLITGAGLFRDGGADRFIVATGIQPDWIVPGHI